MIRKLYYIAVPWMLCTGARIGRRATNGRLGGYTGAGPGGRR